MSAMVEKLKYTEVELRGKISKKLGDQRQELYLNYDLS